jgi:nitrosocyanin
MKGAPRAALSAALAVAVALGLSGCGGTETVRHTVDAAQLSSGVGFVPPTVTVDKRNRVELKVGNTTGAPHGFSIEGYGVQEEVGPGMPIDVKFIANRAGTYRMYCQLHPEHQTATLIVR